MLSPSVWLRVGCFSPVAGIQWVETIRFIGNDRGAGFSPVAGIQWVETSSSGMWLKHSGFVSVPLPGFSGLRPTIASDRGKRIRV